MGYVEQSRWKCRHYPWKWRLKSGTEGVATTAYGRGLMRDMMLTYDGDRPVLDAAYRIYKQSLTA